MVIIPYVIAGCCWLLWWGVVWFVVWCVAGLVWGLGLIVVYLCLLVCLLAVCVLLVMVIAVSLLGFYISAFIGVCVSWYVCVVDFERLLLVIDCGVF